jgi:cyclopropane-fatty-acyl-phospholipid synthase
LIFIDNSLPNRMLENTLHAIFRKEIAAGNLRVAYPSGRTERYGDGSGAPLALRIADPAALRAIVFDPGLSVAEMYMDGRLVLEEGEAYDLIALAKANTRPEVSTPFAWVQHLRRSVTAAPVLHAVGIPAARRNVAHHYDLSGALYELFLDRDLQYSCAYFARPDDTLETAQENKKRHLAAKLLLDRPGLRVLDIGSGWGGLGLYLAREAGADVTGVTLSAEQHRASEARAAAAGLADRVRFRLRDYREERGRYNRVV